MQDPVYGLPRISLLGTWVNMGKRKAGPQRDPANIRDKNRASKRTPVPIEGFELSR
jgi:hypothetical protein